MPRMIFVALNVADLERSVAFYRDGFGIEFHRDSNQPETDVWYAGHHAAYSWVDGAFLHFALFPAAFAGEARFVRLSNRVQRHRHRPCASQGYKFVRSHHGDVAVWRAMAKIDRLKEEVGWLKVMFGILVAIDVSLVAWLAQNYGKASWLLILAGVVATGAVTLGVVRVNQVAYDRMSELEDA